MTQCGNDSVNQFINLSEPIPNDEVTHINSFLTPAFLAKLPLAPTQDPTNKSIFTVTSDAGSGNTCRFTGCDFAYTLVQMQICNVIHKGFTFLKTSCYYSPDIFDKTLKKLSTDGSPQYEFILTFKSKNTIPNSICDDVLLLCFPVYISTKRLNDKFLIKLTTTQSLPNFPSLDTLFESPNIGLAYSTCFNTSSTTKITFKICVFPVGIEVLVSDFDNLPKPASYVLPDSFLNASGFDSSGIGAKTISSHISPNSDYSNWIQTFSVKPKGAGAGAGAGTVPYKCIPIDNFKRDNPNFIVDPENGTKLSDLLKNNRIDPKSEFFDQLKTHDDNVYFWGSIVGAIIVFSIISLALTKHE
jgi:hypothetical protein